MTASLDPKLDAQSPLRLIVWVVGALVMVAMLLTATGLLLQAQLRGLGDVQGQMTISLTLETEQRAEQLSRLGEALAEIDGIASVRTIPRDELAQTLGSELADIDVLAGIRLPTFIELLYDPGSPPDQDQLLALVRQIDPDGFLQAGSNEAAEQAQTIGLLQVTAYIAAFFCMLAIVGIVALTVRSALSAHRQTLDLLRTMGAEDRDLLHQFEAKASSPLLKSVGLGFILGVIGAGLLLLAPIARVFLQKPVDSLSDPLTWLAMILVPMLAGTAVVMTIKVMTKHYLRHMR